MLLTPDEPAAPRSDPESAPSLGSRSAPSSPLPFQRPLERPPRRPIRKSRLIRSFRGAVFGIDWVLRRCYGVHEFSADQDDLLRVAVGQAKYDLILQDGARVAAGDAILDLHIWNERVLGLGRPGSNLGWASRVRRRIDHSLSNLAVCIRAEPSLQSCKALRAETVFVAGREAATALRIAGRFGLIRRKSGTASLGETLVGFGLAWACNPHSLKGKPFRRVRNELWISRAAFLERYAAAQAAGVGSPTAACNNTAPSEPV